MHRTYRFVIGLFFIALFVGGMTAGAMDLDDWHFRVGFQYWKPDMSYEKEIYDYDASTDGLYGPTLFVEYKSFGLGLNYYTGSYDVDLEGLSQTKDRKDIDIYLSYRFFDYFNVFVGYKIIDFENAVTEDFNVDTRVDGLALGLSAGYPILDTGLFVYGSGFYMPKLTGEEKWRSTTGGEFYSYDVDADGYNIEGGVGYLWDITEQFGLSFKAGYRWQSFTYDFDSDYVYDADEDYDGVRFEVTTIF